MSFILDALKKSESDRQRQNGPALFEVKVAPPRTRLPLWALAIVLLLLVNASVVAWMLLHLRRNGARPSPCAGGRACQHRQPRPEPPPRRPRSRAHPCQRGGARGRPPTGCVPAGALGTARPPWLRWRQCRTMVGRMRKIAPAAEPAAPLGSRVRRGTVDGVPLYQDWATTPGTHVPQLRLDLHVYAARPEERFVMINMKKLREGDSLPEGVRVESITPEGAVLSYNGSRFLLPRD